MPATPEQLLAQLDSPTWKRAGSTSRRTEGPTARHPVGGAPVNVTVIDHITTSRLRLADAEMALAAGHANQAERIRRSVTARSLILTGDTSVIRRARCPYCGAHSLLWSGGVDGHAVCASRHCTPIAGTPRRFGVEEAMADHDTAPLRKFSGPGVAPVDLIDLVRAVAFLAPTGHPLSHSTMRRLIIRFGIESWRTTDRRLVSLSDVLVAHAVWVGEKTGACDAVDASGQAACTGLAGLYAPGPKTAAARLCSTCPLSAACSDPLTTEKG